MAREVQIHVWCDPCIAIGERHEATGFTLALRGADLTGAPREIDLCQRHAKELILPLSHALIEYGRAAEQPSSKAHKAVAQHLAGGRRHGRVPEGERTLKCLWCPLAYAASSNSGFNSHLNKVHGLPKMSEVFTECPVCGRPDVKMMTSHLAKSHGAFEFPSITAAYLWAKDSADPHGAYSRVLAKAAVLEGAP